MAGWITLHRKIQDHWIWDDPVKLKWWIDMILEANHADGVINIGVQLIECKRGQSAKSLQTWAKRWKVSKSAVRNFFDLLKKDGMIDTENITVTTRVTIIKYDDYQCDVHAPKTQEKRKKNAPKTQEDPNNNDNNEKKNNKLSAAKATVSLHSKCKDVFHDKFRGLFGEEYYWEAKDAANLNPVIKKITHNRESKSMPVDDDSIVSAFNSFLESITDKWILANFSMPNINSKFNEIISQAKNGRKQQTGDNENLAKSVAAGIARAKYERDKHI